MSKPRRDTDDGDLTCEYCGGAADSTVAGEHIWTCSEATPNNMLRTLVEKWREHGGPADEACADELDAVIGSNSEDGDDV
jgi:hypothetical protein